MRTHQWWKRVCLSIFGMIVVDTMNFHQSCSANTDPNPHTWISELATELIDNTLDSTATRRNYANSDSDLTPEIMPQQTLPCLSPNKKRNSKGYIKQGWCKCGKKTTFVCRACTYHEGRPIFCCSTKFGRPCWDNHYEDKHN